MAIVGDWNQTLEGGAELERACAELIAEIEAEVPRLLERAAARQARVARRLAPRRRGTLARAITSGPTSTGHAAAFVRGGKAVHPGASAGWLEFGGVISPRGSPIRISGEAFMRGGASAASRELDTNYDELLDDLERKWNDD